MKQLAVFLSRFVAVCCLLFSLASCADNEPSVELPESVTKFMEFYFPGEEYASFRSGDYYIVQVRNSATITFFENDGWVDINGNGGTLDPNVLLPNELPAPLYDYLLETENLDGVYQVKRQRKIYTVTLLDSEVRFDANTGQFIGSQNTKPL